MKINRNALINNKTYDFEEEIIFDEKSYPSNIKKIENCHVKVKACDFEEILRLEISIVAKVVTLCAYSLKDVEVLVNTKEEIEISNMEEDSNDCFYEPHPIFDLNPYILGIIGSEVPLKVIKKGETLPDGGNGYRIISEDDLEKERKNKSDSRWDKLDDLDL